MAEAETFSARIRKGLAFLNPWGALARAKADAQRAEQRLREALDALPEGVVFLDHEGRYVLWNKAYAEIYHRSADLFRVGRRLAETLRIGVERGDYPAARGREEAWLAERLALLQNPTAERHEQQIRDGRWVMIEERQTADGGVIGLRIDITEIKAQAAALEEAVARAEAANRAKSDFLANMSHELRTPLNGIIGLAEVLARTSLDERQQELVRELLGSGSRLNGLLSDLLNFNALEAGRMELVRRAFEPAETTRRAAGAFETEAKAKGLDLVVDISAAAEAGTALGDEAKIDEILHQLLSNAVKFTVEGGITVRLGRQDAAEGSLWTLEVADTGPGFDAAAAERLFGGFEMGDASATRKHGGVGLGLAITQRLTSLMGGRIEAFGEPGKGARFVLTLPLADAPPSSDRPLRVLLADDNPTNRKVVELILDAVGAEVAAVENGAEAVAAAGRDEFDLVLMDLQMPVMDGLTAIREIRQAEVKEGRPRRPIIVLSANSAPDDVSASRSAGADGHLGKPIRAEVLLNALAQATGEAPS